MNFIDATKGYETWLARELRIIPQDLEQKHQLMVKSSFQFLRGTYYRWAQIWAETAEALAKTPVVLAVGDLHAENFGTWRDADGRLVWGVNDFDETAALPMALDLTRLAVSVFLASEHHALHATRQQVAHVLLDGYRKGVECGGLPFVLEEGHPALRQIAVERLKDEEAFWMKFSELPEFTGRKPKTALRLLIRLLPHGVESLRVVHRLAGLGSLGRQRLTAIGQFEGGFIAREVKQLAPPASYWATGKGSRQIRYGEILKVSVRCNDPFLRQLDNWIGRRLSPSNCRIEVIDLPKGQDVERLLHAMGFETANLHLGSIQRKKLKKAVDGIKPSELAKVSRALENAVVRDWKEWRAR
ncbi:MAG: DUF2252 family protein [Bryobacteraceae bacterium]|jgi:hypothetical protein